MVAMLNEATIVGPVAVALFCRAVGLALAVKYGYTFATPSKSSKENFSVRSLAPSVQA